MSSAVAPIVQCCTCALNVNLRWHSSSGLLVWTGWTEVSLAQRKRGQKTSKKSEQTSEGEGEALQRQQVAAWIRGRSAHDWTERDNSMPTLK